MRKDILKSLLMCLLIGIVLGCVTSMALRCCRNARQPEGRIIERDTIVTYDTIAYLHPVPKDSVVLRYVTRHLAVVRADSSQYIDKSDTISPGNYAQNWENFIRDSADVEIPITQKRYYSDEYVAYVSGYEPSLDSIKVYPRTTLIRERSYKPPNKFHIGLNAGYGYGIKSKTFEPYVGVGISYSIISF